MFKQLSLGALIGCAALMAPHAFCADQPGARLEAVFKKAGTDNDGTLTRDEAKSMPRVAKNFDAIDADKDGTVSLDEIRASMKQAGTQKQDRAVEKIKTADKDNDGTLHKNEDNTMPRGDKNIDATDAEKYCP